MRIPRTEVSTLRRSAKSWGPGADAPTHLPADTEPDIEQSASAAARAIHDLEAGTGARTSKRLGSAAEPSTTARTSHLQLDPAAPLARGSRPRSDSVLTSAPRPARGSSPAVMAEPQPAALAAARPSQPQLRESQPQVPESQPALRPSQPPFVAFEGGASFDPLALPLPPEIAPAIYDWVRRLALQADLTAADRLLRDAVADLTSALSVVIFYKGPDGLYTLGGNDELPKDQSPIAAVGKARRALVGTHSGFIPICTATDTIAVIQLVRNARQPAFDPVAQITMAAIARESASIMHHLVVKHSMHQAEVEHDKKGLYRPEALENHRNRGQEGVIAELSPGWVRTTYKVLVVAIVVASAFAYFVHVPTYSSGVGIVIFDGTPVTSPAPGTVDTIYVQPAASVHKGEALVKLKADKEEADLAQARSELTAAKQQYLIDSSDETLRKTLISAQAAYKRALDALEQKTVRASTDGTISDIRIRVGAPLEFGAPILTIVAPGTEPELWAYLPGSDRPRLRPGQALQIELTGYQKTRESGTIYDVGRNIIGTAEAKRALGAEVADALKFAPDGSYVLVKAKLRASTFHARGRTYRFHPGMPAKTEVRVESKRFIVTLLPSLEKYIE